MDIYQFQDRLTRRLSIWAVLNIISGGLLAGLRDRFWKGLGIQFAGWGLVDGGIALFGGQGSRKRAAQPEARLPERQESERRGLRNLLWVNTGLDVIYVLGGLWLARNKGKQDRQWGGQGWGIIVQGAFLFVFDLVHAVVLSKAKP